MGRKFRPFDWKRQLRKRQMAQLANGDCTRVWESQLSFLSASHVCFEERSFIAFRVGEGAIRLGQQASGVRKCSNLFHSIRARAKPGILPPIRLSHARPRECVNVAFELVSGESLRLTSGHCVPEVDSSGIRRQIGAEGAYTQLSDAKAALWTCCRSSALAF